MKSILTEAEKAAGKAAEDKQAKKKAKAQKKAAKKAAKKAKKAAKKAKKQSKKKGNKLAKFHKKHYPDAVKHVAALSAHVDRTSDWLDHVERQYDEIVDKGKDVSDYPEPLYDVAQLISAVQSTLVVATSILADYSDKHKLTKAHDKAYEKGSKPFESGLPK